MTDLKTSQFPYTNDLGGTELVGIVQGGVNYQTTVEVITGIVNNQKTVQIGYGSAISGYYGIAIGYNANAEAQGTIAIGRDSFAWGQGGIAIGYDAGATWQWCSAIGYRARASGESSIAIGHGAIASANTNTAIGWYAKTYANYAQVFGYSTYAGPYASHSVALGSRASVNSIRSIAIGHNVEVNSSCDYGIAIGERAYIGQLMASGTCANNIAIGNQARASYSGNVVIGYRANYHTYPAVSRTTVVGGKAYSTNSYGVAVGYYAGAVGPYSIAIGAYSWTSADHSVSILSGSNGQLAVSIGYNSGAGSFRSVGIGGGQSQYAYSTSIGTFASDMCIGSFVTRGKYNTGMAIVPTDHVQRFYGITTSDNQTVVLTADGNSPSGSSPPSNLPSMYRGSVARMTSTVVGYADTGFESSASESASFVLNPTLVVRYDDSSYQIVGDASFTLENSTAGASGWAVPTLTFDGETDALLLTVNNDATQIMWMGFVRFEASK